MPEEAKVDEAGPDGPAETAKTKSPDPFGVGRLLRTVTEQVDGDTGASARLRRLDPEDEVGSPSLHSVIARAGLGNARVDEDDLRRYATCVRIVAMLERVGGDGRGISPGAAFAEMEVSEQRMARLSISRDGALRDLVTSLVRRAVSSGVKVNPWALCEIVLAEGRDDAVADAARRGILSTYYRVLDAKAHAKSAA